MDDAKTLHQGLYYRLSRLRHLGRLPWLRRLLGWCLRLCVIGYFLFALLILALRYWILPEIEQFRPRIESEISQALGLPVTVGEIRAGWAGLRPELLLADVRIADQAGRPALAFSSVDTVLSWSSLPSFSLRLARLTVDSPTLHIRRDAGGRLFVAGMDVSGEGDGQGLDWVLSQDRIEVRDATVVWEDGLRGAPPLVLEALQFRLDNRGSRHRFGFTAVPPPALAGRIDVRGDLRGRDPRALGNWRGQLFAQVDAADLAAWRAWFDYPVDLTAGSGALRLWTRLDGGEPGAEEGKLTADLALSGVSVRLSPDLPVLALDSLSGRLQASRADGETALSARQLAARVSGVDHPPADFAVSWRASGRHPQGQGSASRVDLATLARLAAFLPLDAKLREALAAYNPRGYISDLHVNWSGVPDNPVSYRLQGRFQDLALDAHEGVPGFTGISGAVDATERGGSLDVTGGKVDLDVPGVFPEPRIALDSLAVGLKWRLEGQGDSQRVDVDLGRLDFSGPDAAGEAFGNWHRVGQSGPGEINLSARLTRADARAVWRYMPHKVNADARAWLRRGLVAGHASDARLTLKGPLDKFPFKDANARDGQFLVTVKAHGVGIDYAPGWPVLDGVDADLRFEGTRMRVEARAGRILGTRMLPGVVAEIPDFDGAEEWLKVRGKVEGPTSEFLKFVDQSPVAAKINHFTDDIGAEGNGLLDLGIDMPLRRVVDTTIKGDYEFRQNTVTVLPFLPPLRQVAGHLEFSENGIRVKQIAAQFLGAPLRIDAVNEGEKVRVGLQGGANMAELRRYFGLPLFDYLSGTTTWKGEVRVRKRTAELVIDSDLRGVVSSLPEPLNKPAMDSLAFHLEQGELPNGGGRNQTRFTLGKQGSVVLVSKADGSGVEKGVIALGEAPVLPDKGLSLLVTMPRLDVDFWKKAMQRDTAPDGAAASATSNEGDMPGIGVALIKARELTAMGRRFHDVNLRANPIPEGWSTLISARELDGRVVWDGRERGRLRAQLKHLIVPEAVESNGGTGGDETDSLPALDVVAEQFTVGERQLGRLEMKAVNERRSWRMDPLTLTTPETRFSGKGLWNMPAAGSQGDTQMDFSLQSSDVGKFLERLGYGEQMKRGTADISGRLSWSGAPTAFDPGSLTGEVKTELKSGQFAKLEPGIGKLIGLLSLQNLPRRITLDFRDVFSEGFAFDAINGTFAIRAGLMKTDNLHIAGPAAKVDMRGDIDLGKESQNLRVRVQPAIGDTVALGAVVMAHPVAGAVAYIAQKILQNPLDQVFAFEYRVTGAWEDPKVEKIRQEAVAPAGGAAK